MAFVLAGLAVGCGDNVGLSPDATSRDAPPAGARCLPPSVLDTIDQHVEALRITADLVGTHPGPREAVGFFLFPRLELQRTAVFAGPLIMACDGAFMYDEFCEEDGLCSRIECTGVGAGWKMHFYVTMPVGSAPFYDTATVDTTWLDGATGLTFTTAASTSGGTEDWTMTGSGELDIMFMQVVLSFPALSEVGPVLVSATVERDGTDLGEVTVGGEVVATADAATGRFVPSEACR